MARRRDEAIPPQGTTVAPDQRNPPNRRGREDRTANNGHPRPGQRQRALRDNLTSCDGELLCPNCGEVHGTLDEFDSNLGATFRATMANLDIRRLRMEIDKLQTVSA